MKNDRIPIIAIVIVVIIVIIGTVLIRSNSKKRRGPDVDSGLCYHTIQKIKGSFIVFDDYKTIKKDDIEQLMLERADLRIITLRDSNKTIYWIARPREGVVVETSDTVDGYYIYLDDSGRIGSRLASGAQVKDSR